jgi:hypothetical protein
VYSAVSAEEGTFGPERGSCGVTPSPFQSGDTVRTGHTGGLDAVALRRAEFAARRSLATYQQLNLIRLLEQHGL